MTAENSSRPLRAHCSNCNAIRLADVVAKYTERSSDEESPVWTETDYRVLRCRGCEAVYFQSDSIFSEDVDYGYDNVTGEEYMDYNHTVTYWPPPSRRLTPNWVSELFRVDSDLHSLVGDIYTAMNNDLSVLSAIGMRTVFDRASELLGVDPAETFTEKLDALLQLGKIGTGEREILSILADAGSAAAHRGWRPSPPQLDTMMNIVEGFLKRAFVVDEAARDLKKAVPEKPRRHKI